MTDYERKLEHWKKERGLLSKLDLRGHTGIYQSVDKLTEGDAYCILCGGGPFKIADLMMITRSIDPYVQDEEATLDAAGEPDPKHRVRACQPCFEEHYL